MLRTTWLVLLLSALSFCPSSTFPPLVSLDPELAPARYVPLSFIHGTHVLRESSGAATTSKCDVSRRGVTTLTSCRARKKKSDDEEVMPARPGEPPAAKAKVAVPKKSRRRVKEKKDTVSEEESSATEEESNTKPSLEPLMKEFAMKATVLLREAGGQMDSATFRKRWKFNFPMDGIDRYKQGRRLSVRQLLLRCGELFEVQAIEGSRNKLFVLRGEGPLEGGDGEVSGGRDDSPWIEWSLEGEESVSTEEDEDNFREGAPTLVSKLSPRYKSPSPNPGDDAWDSRDEGEDGVGDGEAEEEAADSEEFQENCVLDGSCCELPFGDTAVAEKALKGIEVLEEMAGIGITFGNVVSYNALLQACARAANEESSQYAAHALNLLSKMRAAGVEPSVESYTAAMKACCKSQGGLLEATALLREVRDRGVLKLPAQSYNLLLDTCTREAALGDSQAVQLALSVLENLRQDGVMPDTERCLALIAAVPQGQGAWQEWTHWSRTRVVELMEESGLEYQAVMQAHQLANALNRENREG